ncbi:helix-turn-helix transcriptional regulator [Maribacter polysaccharolyticus]|uniref:helix-turn-helix transcriptional regulator n=1 Tax=Maribacter polysaccharolyticus TaxID=3020831 RepID=UPI00237F7B20|nr:helix-turn-helix domain-containing protein [Maribacter polysaccharolyticus]MDE3741667.1 helix-turn-helix domain-containing protein [Maribacter polysaccharolyticus]
MKKLKELDKNILIVHYDRESFGELTDVVYCIYTYDGQKDEYRSFESDNLNYTESDAILSFKWAVERAKRDGKTIVQWNQNRPEYGPQHLNNRYLHLTGNRLDLDYGKDQINLAGLLFDVYGDKYISHPRLDNLVALNEFDIQIEGPKQLYARLAQIVKIYWAAKDDTLKTNIGLVDALEQKQEVIDRLKAELKLLKTNEKILTRAEVLEMLDISDRTLSYWTANFEIPFIRIGRRLYFLKSQILEKLNEQ